MGNTLAGQVNITPSALTSGVFYIPILWRLPIKKGLMPLVIAIYPIAKYCLINANSQYFRR